MIQARPHMCLCQDYLAQIWSGRFDVGTPPTHSDLATKQATPEYAFIGLIELLFWSVCTWQ